MGATTLLSTQQGSITSGHFARGHFSPLPPISSASFLVADKPSVQSDASSSKTRVHLPPTASGTASFRSTGRRHTSPAGLRERLMAALSELEEAREERDQLARDLSNARKSVEEERGRVTSLQQRIEDMTDEMDKLQQQLDCQEFVRKRMDVEHRRAVEKINARHRFDWEEREQQFRQKLSGMEEQLEEVVLRAAIDLNRQYRDLSKENKSHGRARRRATDGGMPLMSEANDAKPEKPNRERILKKSSSVSHAESPGEWVQDNIPKPSSDQGGVPNKGSPSMGQDEFSLSSSASDVTELPNHKMAGQKSMEDVTSQTVKEKSKAVAGLSNDGSEVGKWISRTW